MLDKITFANGTIVSKEYLNEVQKGTSFDATTTRDDFYGLSDADNNKWQISQRDGLKDYELANPREEKETAIGRLAHDGVILGYEGTITSVSEATFTEPKTIPTIVGQDQIPIIDGSSSPAGTRGVIIEAGSIKLSNGGIFSWPRTLKQLIGVGGNSSAGPNYLYVKENQNDGSQSEIVISSSRPDIASVPHVPLAELNFNAFEFETGSDGKVMGTGVIDLRPNVFVGNLSNFSSAVLKNTSILNTSQTINPGDRAVIDTRNGSVIISLPDPGDSDGARVAVVDLEGSFDRYPVVLRPAAGTKINGSVDDWIINIRDAHLELFYFKETGEWKFEETPGSDCNPVLGSFISCGGKEFIGTRTAAECPDGQAIPANYPEPSEGVYRYEASSQKCYKEVTSTSAVYSNGEGGLIKVFNAPRCIKSADGFTVSTASKSIIYVSPSTGNDAIDNSGTDVGTPFRTIERALLEAARASRRIEGLDAYDTTVIELAPGDYYVDNSPGVNGVASGQGSEQFIKQVETGFVATENWSRERPYIIVDTADASSNQPPISLNLGRTLYTPSGGLGTIYKLERISSTSSRWKIYLQSVQGSFSTGDRLLYNRLSDFNPTDGGVVVPRGISINGVDLRKVRVRPMYVPGLTPGQSVAQDKRTYIFKVTGGTYVSLLTFTDNQQFSRTHNTVTAVGFASEEEIKGSDTETSYYRKIASLFASIDGWGDDSLSPVTGETTIVAPLANSKFDRSQDLEQNQTGLQSPDLDLQTPASIPGQAILKVNEAGSTSYFKLPDVNSTRSSSPYVFNCSVRSIFGLNGMWVDGSRVAGFRSMVTANYTQVSLQTDPNCYENPAVDYYSDPPTNKLTGQGKKYRECGADPFKYRHWGFRGSYDATIQLVSCFVIGNADHFISESGADLSITNSCSDFGDISLRALGYKDRAFSQDEGIPQGTYLGTKATEIIPPLPLSYSSLSDVRGPTLEDTTISTGFVLDYTSTLNYITANSVNSVQPDTLRVYIFNSDQANPLNLENPPSASDVAFGQYSFTKKQSDGRYTHAGGEAYANRKRIYITGFDENGNSISFQANIALQGPESPGFDKLDDRSKVFAWDSNINRWYIETDVNGIVEETFDGSKSNKGDADADGYLAKKLTYAFKYKVSTSTDATTNLFKLIDFIFNKAPIKIVRGVDRRTSQERIYKTVVEGHIAEAGLRRPQAYYIIEKQAGVAGFPLNGGALTDNPLAITQVQTYDSYERPSAVDVKYPGKYLVYITQSSDARDVFSGNVFPVQDADEPELTEDPSNSITKIAVEKLSARPGIALTGSIVPGINPIFIKTSSSSSQVGFLTSLRRPSVIRASGHTWEWTGYLNYDTAFPTYQGEPLDADTALGKIIVEENGGRVYATGMNEEGNYYIGTTVFDLRSGEQFSIPLKADNEPGNVTNQVLNTVSIRQRLLMSDGSAMIFGSDTNVFFSQDTQLKSLTTGDITASNNPPGVYGTESKAGLVQFATKSDIEGARNKDGDVGSNGTSGYLVVSALQLAQELETRLGGFITAGTGVAVQVTQQPGEDGQSGTEDDFNAFAISIGQDVSTTAEVTFKKVTATEDICVSSDLRLKDNVIRYDKALEKVEKLRGVSYNLKSAPERKRIGLIAQEVKEVLPESVDIDGAGLMTVSYQSMVPVLIEAIKELSDRVKKLEEK